MKINKMLFKLATLIKCVSETNTDKGLLITENELAVGVEAYVTDAESGELVLAPADTYETENQIITVDENGIITAIEEKQPASVEEPAMTENEMACNPKKKKMEGEPMPTEEPVVDEEKEALKIKVGELEAKIAELMAIIAEYKAKEDIIEDSVEEAMKKFKKQEEPVNEKEAYRNKLIEALKNRQ